MHTQNLEGFNDDTEKSSFNLNTRSKETFIIPANTFFKTNTNIGELDETINSMIKIIETGGFECNNFGKIINHRTHMKNHIEGTHIEGVSHPCGHCGKQFRSRNSLQNHVSIYHKAT